MEHILSSIKDDAIIVSFLNKKYMKMFKLFYKYISQFQLENIIIVCLDTDSFTALKMYNVNPILCEYNINNRESFWRFRLEKIIELMETSQKNIIHTDLDCFWFRDIYSDILKRTNFQYDLIGHVAHKMPNYVAQELGFVLCCGLFMIRYSLDNVAWVKAIMAEYPTIEDDQVLFNHYIFHHKSSIRTLPNSYNITKVIKMDNNKTIGMINPILISRNFYGFDSMYGFHPYLRSPDMKGKIREFHNYFK